MIKKLKIILIVIAVVLIMLFVGFSYFLGTQIVSGSTQLVTNEETTGVSDTFFEENGVDYEAFCEKYSIEQISLISSFDGHTIPGDFIYSEDKNRDTVVMVHGLGGNRYTNYPVAELFLENGYNVITYDQRSSNENKAEKTTFGYWEKYDLIDCINYVKQNTQEKKVGVWGTSFGGATAVQAIAYENTQEDISFLILDCPISNMEWMLEEEMSHMNMGLPLSYMMCCGNIVNKMQLGFSYKDADSAEAAKNIQIPTLVINSEADEVTPYSMGKDIYDNLESSVKGLWTVTDSQHAEVWLDYNEEYSDKVTQLLERCQ